MAVSLVTLPVTTTTAPGVTTTTATTPGITTTTLPNPAPPSAADVSAATEQDTAVNVTLSGADLNDCELTFSIVTPPAHGSLGAISSNACALGLPMSDTAAVPYMPAASYTGNDSFTYEVNDGTSDSSPATVRITVKPKGPPVCATGPIQGCRQPIRSQVAKLSLRDTTPDSGDRMLWKWVFGAATSKADFGDPLPRRATSSASSTAPAIPSLAPAPPRGRTAAGALVGKGRARSSRIAAATTCPAAAGGPRG